MLKQEAASLLDTLNLGSGVAETDELLEFARVETSVFHDLLADRVDLVPGTKGSGKESAGRRLRRRAKGAERPPGQPKRLGAGRPASEGTLKKPNMLNCQHREARQGILCCC